MRRTLAFALGPLALACAAGLLPGLARAADPLVAELEQRLARGGVDAVNASLLDGGAPLPRLQRQVAACELQAVSLAVRLARGAQAGAVQAHEEALRAAAGRCPRFVLTLVPAAQVPRVCASEPEWGAARTARELRRRIAEIEADALLHGTAQGRACRDAYRFELRNTRVTLRVASPPR
jgi:hypothetical protein